MQRFKSKLLAHGQSGISLIEVLVTLLVMSLALLGAAGMQSIGMKLNKGGEFRGQAVFLAADLAERIEANRPATGAYLAGTYAVSTRSNARTASTTCTTGVCSSAQLALYDLAQWENAIVATLPQASWSVVESNAPTNPTPYTITISWVDRRAEAGTKGTSYAATDASSQVGLDAAGTGEKFSYTATRNVFR